MATVTVNVDFELDKEYRLSELAEISGYSHRYLEMVVKKGELKYLHIAAGRYGGTIVAGYQFFDWLLQKNKGVNGLIRRIDKEENKPW